MAIATVAFGMTACGSKNSNDGEDDEDEVVAISEKATLKSQLDSVSYALGVSIGNNIFMQKQMGQLPVDSTYFEEMFKGINEGLQVSKNKKREAYVIGLSIGQYIANNAKGLEEQLAQYDSTLVTNPSLVMTGFMNAFKQQNQQIESNEAGMVINNMIKSLSLKGSEGNIKAGEDFLTAKAQEEGVQKTASGLLYKVVKQGNGVKPKADDRVKVHYEGRLIDGTVFDSSLQRGEPAVFPVSGVIAGFKEALMLMPVGSEWEIYIPQNLAYGEQDMGTIKPYSTLIFKLQLLGIEK